VLHRPVDTSSPVDRRVAIARRAATAYGANPHVAAVLIAGSVARGLADEHSDIELDVYWASAPTVDERMAAVEGAGWTRVYAEVDEVEWADGYAIDGVKIDTSAFLTSTIDGYLDAALERADTEPELQVRITALLHGQALHGAAVIDAWRALCADYPAALGLAMVRKGFELWPRERLTMLADRDDVLLLHQDLVENVQRVLDALFGLNRVYAPHPFHKWLGWEVRLLSVAPVDLVTRVHRLLGATPPAAVEQFCALAEETFDLVEKGLPGFDIGAVRAGFDTRRVTSDVDL
jgi:hypothetical protein